MKHRKVVWRLIFLLMFLPFFVACGGGGGGNGSNGGINPPTTSDTIDTFPPYIPCILTATATSSTSVNLIWDASSDNVGVAGYKIYRDGIYLTSASEQQTSVNSYLDTGLAANTRYCYSVSAYDAAGNESPKSSQVCVTTPAVPSKISINYPTDGMLIGGITTVEVSIDYCPDNEIQLIIDGDDVSVNATCSVNSINYIDFNADSLSTGQHTLTVQVASSIASIAVKVDPTELRSQALQFLTTYNTFGTHSGVRRWASMPITLEVSSEIVADGYLLVYEEATQFWTKYTGITFQVVPSTESSVNSFTGKYGVVFYEYGTPFPASNCGASIWTNVDLNTHIASIVTMNKGYSNDRGTIAHELGHSLGIWAEVNDGTNTDHFSAYWRMNPVTAEAIKILYFELWPGAPVPAS